jgi:hypothetical protein
MLSPALSRLEFHEDYFSFLEEVLGKNCVRLAQTRWTLRYPAGRRRITSGFESQKG